MQSDATTVKDYLASLPDDRRAAISKVRAVIRKNLPKGIVETMNWGMISYEVPLSVVPDTYNGQPLAFAALASQKNYMSVYLMSIYARDEVRESFLAEYRASGKKLDMGKSCVRFKKIEDLPLDLIGRAVAQVSMEEYVAAYENSRAKT
jgi:uncharacterized protein YdhG (YjbR/CyaY superfamily)